MDVVPEKCSRTITFGSLLIGCEKQFGHDDQHGALVAAREAQDGAPVGEPFPVVVQWGQELTPQEIDAMFGQP